MSVTAVQTRSAQSTSATAVVAITTTGGNLLGIVTGSFGNNPTIPIRTGETNNAGVAPFQDAATDALRGDYMMNIGGNSNTVTGGGTTNGTACSVTEFAGAKTTLALGAVNHGIGTATTVQPGSITPTAASALMSGTSDNGVGTAASTIDSSFIVDEVGGLNTVWDEASAIGGSAHLDNVAGSAVNPTWTTHHTSVTAMAALVMEFLAAVGVSESHSDPAVASSGLVAQSGGTNISAGHQVEYAISDVSDAGLWTNELGATSPLYASVDEVSINDADYIQSPLAPVNAACVLRLGVPAAPVAGDLTIWARIKKNAAGASPLNITIEAMQGAAVIQTWTFNDVSATPTTQQLTITPGAITDWTIPIDLRTTGNQP